MVWEELRVRYGGGGLVSLEKEPVRHGRRSCQRRDKEHFGNFGRGERILRMCNNQELENGSFNHDDLEIQNTSRHS